MEIVRKLVPEQTLADFATAHGLKMRVTERPSAMRELFRFYAEFEGAEILGDGVLISTTGNGNTEAEAIKDYAAAISERVLVLRAYGKDRKEIRVPRIVPETPAARAPGSEGRLRERDLEWNDACLQATAHLKSAGIPCSPTKFEVGRLVSSVRVAALEEVEEWLRDVAGSQVACRTKAEQDHANALADTVHQWIKNAKDAALSPEPGAKEEKKP
ncbi:MAG TPA: hypothetical protein VJP77_05800 [Planctomycetota bacterium]|nr:hypothetical protein [Planctomycetota bacterium]